MEGALWPRARASRSESSLANHGSDRAAIQPIPTRCQRIRRRNDFAGVVHLLYGSSSELTATGSQLWSQYSVGIAGTAEGTDFFWWRPGGRPPAPVAPAPTRPTQRRHRPAAPTARERSTARRPPPPAIGAIRADGGSGCTCLAPDALALKISCCNHSCDGTWKEDLDREHIARKATCLDVAAPITARPRRPYGSCAMEWATRVRIVLTA